MNPFAPDFRTESLPFLVFGMGQEADAAPWSYPCHSLSFLYTLLHMSLIPFPINTKPSTRRLVVVDKASKETRKHSSNPFLE